ncbi:MAG TPA: mechanosensitive ion channel family protein [Polyangiaceae bacterium]|nr:mechanosensitive ion channel family protein [Polyangiaceae bacterium]
MSLFGRFGLVLPLGLWVILVAALFRWVPGVPRKRLRRSVILYGAYASLLSVSWVLTHFKASNGWSGALLAAAALVELFLIINLAALTLFDFLAGWVRVKLSDILHDLAVGVAYLVAIVWSMHSWGVNLTGIVATSAVATAVIGLSLQSTLGNVIGGLALQLDDSIKEGDWVELENKTQGRVQSVRWRHTVLETRDHDTLIVPNSMLLNQTIKVLGKRAGEPLVHRMWVYFNVDHRFAPGAVIRVVDEALRAASIENVAEVPAPQTICYDLAREHRDSYCYYAVRYFLTDLARDDPTSSEVRERIYAALRRAGMPLALPAATLFLSHEDQKSERRLNKVKAEIHAALRGVDLFSKLSEEELDILAESAKHMPFVRGEIITRQGAKAHFLYVLVKGEVEVRVSAEDEDRRVAVVVAPGFFGEMALMTGAPREATVVSLTDVECLRVDKDDFRAVLARRPEIAQEISTLLAQRRVELSAVRDNLDADAKRRRMQTERGRILAAIRDFFALEE